MVTKQCKKCGQIKALSTGFYKHPGMIDGHLNVCKDCQNTAGKENYKQNKPRYIAQEYKARQQLKDAIKEKKEYPLYKFECGCTIDQAEADRQRAGIGFTTKNKLKCPEHPDALVTVRIGVCSDCGCIFEFNKIGPKHKQRCKDCAVKHKAGYDSGYHAKYQREGPRKSYANADSSQPPDHNIKTDLKPNPVITNPDRPPCTQGCRVHAACAAGEITKNNTACVECAYRSAYAVRIEGFCDEIAFRP